MFRKMRLSAGARPAVGRRWLLVLAATFVLPAVAAGAAWPSEGQGVVTSSRFVPLTGRVFYQPTDEFVDIVSRLHVVTRSSPEQRTVDVEADVAEATATGVTSGERYVFSGADRVSGLNFRPGDPVRPTVAFKLYPPGPILPPHPVVPVRLSLLFDEGGRLVDADTSFGGSFGEIIDE